METSTRLYRPFAAILLALLLTACGSRQADVGELSDSNYPPIPTTQAKTGASSSAPRAMVPAPQGGGYYKSDGPHAMIPADLDEIPDATPRIDPIHPPSLRPYTVMGQRFVPRSSLNEPYKARGHASWYGRKFHGRQTAIGETYDMYEMTAAHPTLPLPSYVRVTNISNGRSVIVRVNDRGPFLRGRLIDLSYAAAHRLGYINAGSAQVEVELLTHDAIARMPSPTDAPATQLASAQPASLAAATTNSTAPAPGEVRPLALSPSNPASPAQLIGADANTAYLQLGAFSSHANAARLMARVQAELDSLSDQVLLLSEAGRYRLQIGPFPSINEARSTAGRIALLLDVEPYLVMR